MAAFQIHKDLDTGKCPEENIVKKKIIFKKSFQSKGVALQDYNNGRKPVPKRATVIGNKENEMVIAKKKTGEPKKIDCNIVKIVALKEKKQPEKDEVASSLLLNTDEYSKDIWSYHKKMECALSLKTMSNYMSKQEQLNWSMRSVLVDWLVCVADEYKMSEESLHLGVNFVDRFLSRIAVVREKFQLVGAAAMLIAGKLEDVYPPIPEEWAFLTGDCYTTRQVLKMEQLILKVLRFSLQPPTILTFIQRMCVDHKMDSRTMYLAMFLSELVLLEGSDYLKHPPSELAAASVVLARHNVYEKNVWPKELEEISGYSLNHLSPVVQKQHETFNNSPLLEQQAIQTKYKSDKYHKVAMMKPRTLFLDKGIDV